MDRPFQFGLRQLLGATALIAAMLALATDMVGRVLSQQGDTFAVALEGNALAATVVILVELAWFKRND